MLLGFTDFLEAPSLELESAVEMKPVAKPKPKPGAKKRAAIKNHDDEPPQRRHKACEQDVNRIAALRARRGCVKTCARPSTVSKVVCKMQCF